MIVPYPEVIEFNQHRARAELARRRGDIDTAREEAELARAVADKAQKRLEANPELAKDFERRRRKAR